MKRFLRLVSLTLLIMSTSGNTFAEEKVNVARQGTIRGRIVDTSKQILPGASIYIEKLHTGVTSDVNGYYTFANLTPGTYTVKVSYVGYSPVEMKITIPAGKTLEKDVVLNEGLELQEVVVGGAFQGQRRAINSQKNNLGITNVVSADQVGKFPDSNIGDALKRINGINVQYDQGEARFGQVRGTSADLSSVTINGNRLPSAEGDTRNVQLDLIPADMVQTIEVNKVVTSDMDGDAIGGSINLVTKSTPYKRMFSATAGTGYNWISQKAQLNLGFTYGDRFFNDKLGMMAAISYQNAPSGSDDVEFEYDVNKKGEVVMVEAQKRQYYVTRERQSYSLAFDYDINPNHRLTLQGIYNRRHDWENRYRVTYKDLDKTGLDDEGDMQQSAQIETKGGTPDNRNARLELQQTMDLSLSGEHQFGKLSVNWGASYARASENRPNERYFSLKQDFLGFTVVDAGDRFPYVTTDVNLHNGEADGERGKWKVKELTESNQEIYEKDLKFKVDFELPLTNGIYGNSLRFGAKYASKTKDRNTLCYDYADTYKDTIKYNGWNWNVADDKDETETLEPTGNHKNSYVNWLPSLLFKYDVTDDLKLRASFTETLSRPKYSALIPCVNINRSDNELVMGNSDLTPTISYNFDLSADYYFKSVGLISAGIFYKKINDFIVDQVIGDYTYQNNEYKKFTQPKNAGDADLLGVELAYQRDFGFIAPALKCIGFYGTYTYTHTQVNNFNFEGRENEKDLSLPGSPEHTANASLYFEKKGFNVRFSYNYASSFIDEMGEVAALDRYYDAVSYMDLNASYTFGKKIKTTFYADATNLLNQPLRYYQGTKDRTMQAEYYGVKINAGVKVNF